LRDSSHLEHDKIIGDAQVSEELTRYFTSRFTDPVDDTLPGWIYGSCCSQSLAQFPPMDILHHAIISAKPVKSQSYDMVVAEMLQTIISFGMTVPEHLPVCLDLRGPQKNVFDNCLVL